MFRDAMRKMDHEAHNASTLALLALVNIADDFEMVDSDPRPKKKKAGK